MENLQESEVGNVMVVEVPEAEEGEEEEHEHYSKMVLSCQEVDVRYLVMVVVGRHYQLVVVIVVAEVEVEQPVK